MSSITTHYTRMDIRVNTRMSKCLIVRYACPYILGMDIGKRLDKAMKFAGLRSQAELGRVSGVPQPTVNRILKGGGKKGPETDTVRKLATACGVSFNWLNLGEGGMVENVSHIKQAAQPYRPVIVQDDDNQNFIGIKRVKLRISAGISGFATDPDPDDAQPISFRRDWLEKKGFQAENLIAVEVKGESMEPTLSEGDTVVINIADRSPKDGVVFAVNYEGEAVIKRLARDIGQWWLGSDNPDQRKFHRKLCEGEACIIIGKIVLMQSDTI